MAIFSWFTYQKIFKNDDFSKATHRRGRQADAFSLARLSTALPFASETPVLERTEKNRGTGSEVLVWKSCGYEEYDTGWWLSHPSEKYEFVSWDD